MKLSYFNFLILQSTVWGIPVAILGIPMTISIILFCQEFEVTLGVAIVLGKLNN